MVSLRTTTWMLGALFVCTAATAQATVNTERLRLGKSAPGWSSSLDGSFALNGGNTDLTDLGLGLRVQYDSSASHSRNELTLAANTVFLSGTLRHARSNDEEVVDHGFVHLRWTHLYNAVLGSEVFLQTQYDDFQDLTFRQLFGTGARVLLAHTREFRTALGSGPMFEIEKVRSQFHRPLRWNNYVSLGVLPATSQWGLSTTFYIQPAFQDFSDFRTLNETELRFRMTKNFSFATALTFTYDSAPPAGIQRQDLALTQSIRWEL